MSGLRYRLQHLLNPLHLYCRLRDVGVSAALAVRMSALYERYLYRTAANGR